jgi:signal transduction histidine kinase
MAAAPRMLFPLAWLAFAGLFIDPTEAAARVLMPEGQPVDARLLFSVGLALGVMAFAIGTAIFCLRTTRRAREETAAARREAETLRMRKHRLEAILVAEPQILFAWTESPALKLLVANLPPSLGVPSAPDEFLRFSDWLYGDEAAALTHAVEALTQRGEAFNLMLRTLQDKYIEIDGRAAGAAVTLRVRDLAGQRADLARQADEQRSDGAEAGALTAILDALPSPAWMRDAEGRLIWVNQAYADAAGAGTGGAAVAQQTELLNGANRAAIAAALASGRNFQQRIEVSTPQGMRRCEASVIAARRLSAGIAVEIAESEAVSSDGTGDRLRGFDRMATAFAAFDRRQRLVHFNQAYAELWGLDAEWLASRPSDGDILDRLRLARRLPEKADYQDWKRGWLETYGKDAQFDDQWHLPDGRTLHVVIDSAPEGGVTYLYENVTERLALESRYNALIQVQRETIDTLREGVAVFAPDGTLRLCNHAFASIWRLSPRQLDGQPHIDELIRCCRVLYDNPEEWERTKTQVTAIVSERRPYESRLERPDGSVIATAALPLPDGGTLLTYVDVSDSVRAERALIEKNEALEAADRLKTAFISHVSYELRTPLTNIIGFTDLLFNPATGDLTQKQREYLDDIRASGRTLLSIIDDILDLASIDAGGFGLNPSTLHVRAIVDTLQSGLQDRLKQAGLRLEVDIAPDVDRFVGDEQRVTQILYNLLSNAIGFSPAGGVISLSCRREPSRFLAFTVKDQGSGMPKEYQAVAFDRFESRSDGSGHRGAGLGLSIVKSLVELHGGRVSLRSGPGQGTEVRVWLPLGDPAEAGETDLIEAAPSSRAG